MRCMEAMAKMGIEMQQLPELCLWNLFGQLVVRFHSILNYPEELLQVLRDSASSTASLALSNWSLIFMVPEMWKKTIWDMSQTEILVIVSIVVCSKGTSTHRQNLHPCV